MKKHLSTISLVLVLLIGFSLLLYPTVSDSWNSFHQSRAIVSYNDTVDSLDAAAYDQLWADARAYNAALTKDLQRFVMDDQQRAQYESLLNVAGNGIMGYIEIPSLGVSLPVYHGTGEAVLQVAVGHIEGTSLPIGGAGTHTALSGHRGLPSAKLFTELDRLAVGDGFMLHVLDETLTYEVDQILTVLPDDMSALAIDPAQDYCTLVTCTPYGVNSHRLLVRGRRVAAVETVEAVHVGADAVEIAPRAIAPFVAALLAVIAGMILWINSGKR